MSDATAAIRIDIIASGAEAGARRVNTALDSIGRKGKSTAAANDNVTGSLERISKALTGTSTHGSKFNAVLENIRVRAASAAPEVANLTGTITKMGPMAAVIGGIALAIGAVASKAIEAARKQELWLANLQTVTGDATKAKESYAALVNFAAKTPFDLGQSVEGFIKLRTLGLQATEGALMSFGNTAAAMGKPLNQMIEAVADAATGEFERLKEFGIKSKVQGDQVAFTFGGVTTKVKNNATEIQKYLENLGNTKFGGAMARQMDTINGAASNLEDAIFQAFAAIGSGSLGNSFKEILKTLATGVSAATPMFASLGNVIGSIVGAVGNVLNSLGNLWLSLHGGASAGTDTLTGLTVTFNLVAQGVEVFGNIVAAVFGAFAGIVNGVTQLFSDGFTTLLNWMGVSFETGGRSWANSTMGILRAVKAVVGIMPQLFSVAINDVMKMFRSLGSIVGRLLSGDLSALKDIGGAITGSFGNTAKALSAASRIAAATYKDVKGADAAITRLTGVNTTKAKLDTGALVKPAPADGKKDKDKGETDSEKRAKAEAEFWKTLQGEVETAKLLPLAAEDHRKELELQKILGRGLNTGEKTRVDTLMQQARTAKFVTAALDTNNKAPRQNANDNELFVKRLAGITTEQAEIENKVLGLRNDALDQAVDLQSDAYKLAEAALRLTEGEAAAIKKKNDQLATAVDLARQYSGAFQRADARKTANDNLAALDTAYNGGRNGLGITKQVYDEIRDGLIRAEKDVALNMKADFGARIGELGDQISGKWGDAIGKVGKLIEGLAAAARGDSFGGLGAIGGILDVIGRGKDGNLNGVGKAASDAASSTLDKLFSKGTITDPLKSLSTGFGDFKSDLGQLFGKGGSFTKGLGSVLGKAGMGAQIGDITSSLAGGIGIKLNKTGSQIGGALGGAVLGPLGAIGGSVLGGLLGGLFSKPKYGTAQLTGSGDAVVSGRGSTQKKAASGAAGSVQAGINSLAAELGGKVGSYLVSIGTYDGNWRVSTSGQTGEMSFGKKNKKNWSTLTDFGKDGEAAAIQFAIEDAIKDGAITGLSPIVQKALQTLSTDAAVQFAKDWSAAMADYKSMTDPMGAAVDAIIKPLDVLKETMLQVGASSEDLAKFEDYRKRKLDEVLKEQTSSLRDILDNLNGDAGGVTALTQLTRNLTALDGFKADITAGKTVDQSAYADLANKIMGGASDVYGANTSQYQDIVSLLKDVTGGALTNATNAFNVAAGNTTVVSTDSTTAAVNAQTDQITATIGVSNDYLAQIAASLQNVQFSGLAAYKLGSINGSLLQAY